jgi:hypothetical protein
MPLLLVGSDSDCNASQRHVYPLSAAFSLRCCSRRRVAVRATWKTLVGCPWIDFALFLLSRCIFYMVATTPIGFRSYARSAVVRCQPRCQSWATLVAWTEIHQPAGGSTHVSRIAQKSISQLSTLESVSNVCHDRRSTDLSPRFRKAARR